MRRKVVGVWISIMIIFNAFVIIDDVTEFIVTSSASTFYVNTTGSGGAYTNIQYAIDNASEGDTVFVYEGMYSENVIINKTINLTGNDRDTTIIDAGPGVGSAIEIVTDFVNVTGFTLINSSFSNGGLYINNANYCTIVNNNISFNEIYGIRIISSSYNRFSGNILMNNQISLDSCSNNNIISYNNISSNFYGIAFYGNSNNNTISDNNISSNYKIGVRLYESENNSFSNNYFMRCGFILEGTIISHFNSHDIPINNSIDGKPVYYIRNSDGIGIEAISVGQIILSNCSNGYIKNLELNYTAIGIAVTFSLNITIDSNRINNPGYGISLYYSTQGTIMNNTIVSHSSQAIYLRESANNNILRNNITGNFADLNSDGIYICYSSNNNTILNNSITTCGRDGLVIYQSSFCIIIGNNISLNDGYGLAISLSSYNNLAYNNLTNDGVFISGWEILHYTSHDISINNTVNNKSIFYYKDTKKIEIDGIEAGQIILVNCTAFDVKNLRINNTDVPLEIAYCDNISVRWNNFSYTTEYGIHLAQSSYNLISNNILINNEGNGMQLLSSSSNTIINNYINTKKGITVRAQWSMEKNIDNLIVCNQIYTEWTAIEFHDALSGRIIGNNLSSSINDFGVYAYLSSNVEIYHNNFNDCRGIENNFINFWDNGYPSGGNYWSDYNGVDLNSTPTQDVPPPDGIGDTPHYLKYDAPPESKDKYPLMEPLGESIYLFEGWNLISLPNNQSDTHLYSVLSSIDGYFDAIQWYKGANPNDHWRINKIGKPFGNDLFEINETMGFWIHITEPDGVLFEYPGTKPAQNQTIPLYVGWNHVGFPSKTRKNRTVALNNLDFGNEIDAIWTYNSIFKRWEEIGETDWFEVSRGYFIHSKVETTWEVPL